METENGFSTCSGTEDEGQERTGSTRRAAFAGRFYPEEARALQLSLDNHFTRANDHELHHLRALI
ncbi:MAG TPA: hypothetical protein P5550_10570, partial [Bacteroidales bacterium]|nr:hypothetical protein [Bacteroidales bacterium]